MLQLEINKKSELEDRFKQDIEDLSQETESLVNEYNKAKASGDTQRSKELLNVMVKGIDALDTLPLIGLIASCTALVAITAGTLWQKKLSMDIPLATNNMYQSFSASIFLLVASLYLENPFIHFTTNFILAMGWQIIAVSFGAFTILMFLIKIGSASKTSTLFFLIPPVSAVMAWMFVDEVLTTFDVIGLAIATLGVYIATRKENEKLIDKV